MVEEVAVDGVGCVNLRISPSRVALKPVIGAGGGVGGMMLLRLDCEPGNQKGWTSSRPSKVSKKGKGRGTMNQNKFKLILSAWITCATSQGSRIRFAAIPYNLCATSASCTDLVV